jgi:hypothetical protein
MELHSSTAKIAKYSLVLAATIGLVLGLSAIQDRFTWYLGLPLLYGAGFWAYPVVLTWDMVAAGTRRSSTYQCRFYKEIQRDVVVAALSGLAITAIYRSSSAHYESSSFDIFSAAIPFLIMGALTVAHITRMELMDHPMKRSYRAFMLSMITLACALAFAVSIRVASSKFNLLASTWLQITTLCVALFIYVESRRVQYVLEVERMELSPVLLSIFGTHGPYGKMAPLVDRWNRLVSEHRQRVAVSAKKESRRKRK